MFHIIFFVFVVLLVLWMIFQKESEEIILLIIIGAIIYYWIPNAIGYFFDDFSSKMIYERENVKFWSDYGGNIIGPIITLFGVWWQVTRQEKQKERDEKIGLLRLLHYHLEKNKDFEKKKYNILSVLYFTGDIFLGENDVEAIHSFNDMDFKKNQLKIMSLDYGKKILDINSKILSFNKEWIFLFKSSKSRKKLIKTIKENIKKEKEKNEAIEKIIEILEDLSEIIFYYTYYNFNEENIKMIKAYKKNLYWKIVAFRDSKELKKYIDKILKILTNEKEYDFFSQNKKAMLLLSNFLREGVELLYNFVFDKEIITEEEEAELFKYYISISEIISVNTFDLLYEIQKIDKRIVKDLEKLEGLIENKKRKICLKRLQRVKKRSPKLYNIIKFYIKKRLVWTKLIKNIKLYIDKLLYKC